MKKKLMLTVILALVMMPLALLARTVITDGDLSNVTAQSGVTINFNSLPVSLTISRLSWGDTNGVPNSTYTNGYENAGYLGAANVAIKGEILNGSMNVDVGTTSGKTAVNLSFANLGIGGAVGGSSGLNIDAVIAMDTNKYLSNVVGSANVSLAAISVKQLKIELTGTVQVYAH